MNDDRSTLETGGLNTDPIVGASALLIFENCSDGVMIAETETQEIRYANPAAVRMLGHSRDALCEMRISDLSPKDSLQTTLADFESLAGGRQASLESRRRLRKDGTVVVVDISAALITAGGRPMVAAFYRDQTARSQAEGALKASEARYRRLFESARDGILILDAGTGRIVDVNPFLLELTGYPREDFLGRTLWEIGPFKDSAASKASFAELQAQNYVRYDDLPLARRGGGKVEVEFISNVYFVGDQKVVQCNIRDISARKRDEAERVRLSTAIEQAAEAVVITDAQGAIEYVNPAFERVTGYSRAEALGHNPRLLKSGVQSEAFYRELWATISSGRTWTGRVVNKKKDGTLYTEDTTISPIRDAGGAITSYVAVKRDVSATLVLEAQYLQAQKMEAVGRLAGGVAHDFNNVLSVILSYAELIASDLKPADPIRADVEEIKRAGLRAADLARQLLAFSRRQVLEMKVLNLNEILAGMEKMLARLLGADIALTMLPASGLWNVEADPGQVEQVLMNLAVNARDAMPQGGKLTIQTANVELGVDYASTHHEVRPGPYVEIVVSDTGAGMDRDTQAQIFEPFFTTKERGKGTGLGLATVFGIVRQSGGHIWVYSEPGVGTTFKVYFPKAGKAPEIRPSAGAAPQTQRGTETILLVEDDDQVRVLARDILRRSGYVVLEAPNGGEAFLMCEQHGAKIHLLLTDVVLPRMNGRQLAERLAPMRPEMKVLFMSGYTDDAILLHGILDSGVAFLRKPLTPAALTNKVREVLDRKDEVGSVRA